MGETEGRMSPAVDLAITQLIESGVVAASDLVGCSEADILAIEQAYSVRLPATYRYFLTRLGRRAGAFMQGTDFLYSDPLDIFHQRDIAESLLSDSARFVLSRTHFVFMSHQGYQILFFECDGSDDPPVMHYLEGDPLPKQAAESFSTWFAECVADEIRLRSEEGDTPKGRRRTTSWS
jgi:hypothetical protein